MSQCCHEIDCFNVVAASEEEDEGDDFLGAEDFSRKKVTLDKSKPAKAIEVSFSFLVLVIIVINCYYIFVNVLVKLKVSNSGKLCQVGGDEDDDDDDDDDDDSSDWDSSDDMSSSSDSDIGGEGGPTQLKHWMFFKK